MPAFGPAFASVTTLGAGRQPSACPSTGSRIELPARRAARTNPALLKVRWQRLQAWQRVSCTTQNAWRQPDRLLGPDGGHP
jgi:hypothetical protein